jgi:hypothetical protein
MHEAAYGGHDKCVELLVAAGDRTAVCNDVSVCLSVNDCRSTTLAFNAAAVQV